MDGVEEELTQVSKKLFELTDTDGSGSIDQEELAGLVSKIAKSMKMETPSKFEIKRILKEYDENQDGVLQLEEFKQLVKALFAHKFQPQQNNVEKKQEQTDDEIRENFIRSMHKRRMSQLNNTFMDLLKQKQRQSVDLGQVLIQLEQEKKSKTK